jgi:hypothetical protein
MQKLKALVYRPRRSSRRRLRGAPERLALVRQVHPDRIDGAPRGAVLFRGGHAPCGATLAAWA